VGNAAVPPAQASSRRRFGVGAVALALGGAGGATGLWWWLSGAAATRSLPRAEQPSIVVLPIRNISGGERWDRLARGMTEDVTTDLARNHWLFIIASSAAFQRAASGKDSLTIARELGVRFVLEGTLQAEGDALRVNARLLEAAGGSSVWSQRWDKAAGQLFDIQDSIVGAIDSSLGSAWTGAIAATDREKAKRRSTRNLAAYELYLLGTELKHRFTPAAVEEGVEHLNQAVRLDPGFAKAWVSLAIAHFNLQMFARDAQKRDREMAARLDAIKQAFRSDPDDPEALIQHSVLMALEGNTSAAQRALRSAAAAAPNNADVLAVAAAAGSTRCPLGDEPLDWAQRAQRLNPNPPNWYFIGLGKSALYTHRFALAIDSLAKAPDIPVRWWNAAAAHALHGEVDAARRAVVKLMEMVPGTSTTKILADRSEWGDEAARTLFLKGARLAGMPE
jgi:TolB-like protein